MPRVDYTASDVLDEFENRVVRQVRTNIPGSVTRYDEVEKVCDVQPHPNMKLLDGTTRTLSQILNCPILEWGTGQFGIHAQAQVGDLVWVSVSDRALDTWRQVGDVYTPEDARHHNLTDAVVIPGLYSSGRQMPVQVSATQMYLGIRELSKKVYLELDAAGTGTTTLQGGAIKLGPLATLGVARLTDVVSPNAAMIAWMTAVQTAINTLAPGTFPGPPPTTLGTITTASSKVKSE